MPVIVWDNPLWRGVDGFAMLPCLCVERGALNPDCPYCRGSGEVPTVPADVWDAMGDPFGTRGMEWAVWRRDRPRGRWKVVATAATQSQANRTQMAMMRIDTGSVVDWVVLPAKERP